MDIMEASYLLEVPLNIDDQISACNKTIETSQMALYRFFDDEKKSKLQRRSIKSNRNMVYALSRKKQDALRYTLEGKIEDSMERFKFKILSGENKPSISGGYNSYMPSFSQVRELARSDWFLRQADSMNLDTSKGPLTDFQLTLMSFSSLYKNVKELDDKPSARITNDDDAFDGWLLVRDKGNASKSKAPSKHDGAQQVFNFVNSQEEATQGYLATNPHAAEIQKAQAKQTFDKMKK